MRRWLTGSLGGLSGILTAATVAATALAAVTVRGPSTEDLIRELAVVDRELALAHRTSMNYRANPLMAEQVELRIAVLDTTRAMLEQKRLSWARGLKLIYRVDGDEVVPDRAKLEDLHAKLADVEAAMLTARNWAARSTNEVTKNMALSLEQVHLLTHAVITQQIAFEELGMSAPPSPKSQLEPSAAPAPEDRTGVVGVLERPASVRR